MQNWPHFSNPEFALGFQYPQTTPHGHVIEKAERRDEGAIRIHFTSKDSRELYFEIAKYDDLSPQVEYRRHKENLEKGRINLSFQISKRFAGCLNLPMNILLNGHADRAQSC